MLSIPGQGTASVPQDTSTEAAPSRAQGAVPRHSAVPVQSDRSTQVAQASREGAPLRQSQTAQHGHPVAQPAPPGVGQPAPVPPAAQPRVQPAHAEQPPPIPQRRSQQGEGWLSIRAIVKSFKNRTVVRGVSLDVRRGEAVGLLGPNGAGKTTTFYMITGLIPADEGSITIDGQDVTRLPMYRRARLGIGYLPQEASIFRGLTVEENILAVLETVEPNKKARREQLDALLEEFRITRLRKSPSMRLSGGERRRVEIARALATRPSYMLLDEPFAGIDPIAVNDIRALVRHLTQRGIGVLITDHNVRETLDLVGRAYIIHDGSVLTHGTTHDIVNNEDVRRVYLGDDFKI